MLYSHGTRGISLGFCNVHLSINNTAPLPRFVATSPQPSTMKVMSLLATRFESPPGGLYTLKALIKDLFTCTFWEGKGNITFTNM